MYCTSAPAEILRKQYYCAHTQQWHFAVLTTLENACPHNTSHDHPLHNKSCRTTAHLIYSGTAADTICFRSAKHTICHCKMAGTQFILPNSCVHNKMQGSCAHNSCRTTAKMIFAGYPAACTVHWRTAVHITVYNAGGFQECRARCRMKTNCAYSTIVYCTRSLSGSHGILCTLIVANKMCTQYFACNCANSI
jgi:hypothetical protein